MKDTSLRVPSGIAGTVIDVQVFTREGIERDKRAQSIIDEHLRGYKTDLADQMRIVERDTFSRVERLITGKVANGGPKKLAKGTAITAYYLAGIDAHHWFDIRMADEDVAQQLEQLSGEGLEQTRKDFDVAFEEKRKKLTQGDELPRACRRWSRFMSPSSVACSPATRWPAATATRASSRASCRWKTCRTTRTATRSTSC